MTTESLQVFVWAFVLSAFAGVAALLRRDQSITSRRVWTAVTNSGVLGLGISLLWYSKFQDNVAFLVGLCVIAGLGGMTTIDYVLAVIRKGGFSVKLGEGGVDVTGIKLEDTTPEKAPKPQPKKGPPKGGEVK